MLEFEPRCAESQFHVLCVTIRPSQLPGFRQPFFSHRLAKEPLTQGRLGSFSGSASRAIRSGVALALLCTQSQREEEVTGAAGFHGACRPKARAPWSSARPVWHSASSRGPTQLQPQPLLWSSPDTPTPFPHLCLLSRLLWKLTVQTLIRCCLLSRWSLESGYLS